MSPEPNSPRPVAEAKPDTTPVDDATTADGTDALYASAAGISPVTALTIIVSVIFTTEVALMLAFDAWPVLPNLVEALINALVLVLVLSGLLYLLVYLPMRRQIIERGRVITSLSASERRFRDIAAASDEWIWEVDANGRYTYASPAVERILGYTVDEILGKHFYDLFHPDERESLKHEAFEVFKRREPFRGFINHNLHKNGASVWLSTTGLPIVDAEGELTGYRGADALKYEQWAVTDPLTGVLNRSGFYLLAEHQFKLSNRNRSKVAVLFIDMNGLKAINDRHGHLDGDRAIARTAKLLQSSVRQSDIIARFGGDEFVVLLVAEHAEEAAEIVISQIKERFDTFNRSGALPFSLNVSVGVAFCDPAKGRSLDQLIGEADRSMYEQKRNSAPR